MGEKVHEVKKTGDWTELTKKRHADVTIASVLPASHLILSDKDKRGSPEKASSLHYRCVMRLLLPFFLAEEVRLMYHSTSMRRAVSRSAPSEMAVWQSCLASFFRFIDM